jgi:sugar phosphate permease
MKPSTVWIAIVLLALGVCGILDAAGVVDSSQTIAQWWPLAILGWAAAEMLAERRMTLGGLICTAIGLALLADAQSWASGALLWSGLAIIIGLTILVEDLRGSHRHNGDSVCKVTGGGAS